MNEGPITNWYIELTHLDEVTRSAAKELEITADTDEQLTDLAGTLNALASHLGAQKRGVLAEQEGGRYGRLWQFTQGRKYTRSYNTSRLFGKFINRIDDDLVAVIRWLIEHRVISIEWKYKNLMSAARQLDMPITTVAHEIEDGDPEADIGEVEGWASASWKYREEKDESVLGD